MRAGRAIGLLTALWLLAGAGWYFFLRDEPGLRTTPRAAACPTPSATPVGAAQPPVTPAQTRVNIYNATDRKGLAAQTATALSQRGFVIGAIANDPLRRTVAGTAEVRSGVQGKSRSALVAAQLAGALPLVDTRADLSVDLVLGQRFTALRTPAEVAGVLAPPKPPGC